VGTDVKHLGWRGQMGSWDRGGVRMEVSTWDGGGAMTEELLVEEGPKSTGRGPDG
jgi:hypothetical protein